MLNLNVFRVFASKVKQDSLSCYMHVRGHCIKGENEGFFNNGISLHLPSLFATSATVMRVFAILCSLPVLPSTGLQELLLLCRNFAVSCSTSSNQIVLSAFRNVMQTNLAEGQASQGVLFLVISHFIKKKSSGCFFHYL